MQIETFFFFFIGKMQIETLIASLWLLWRKPLQPFSQPEKRKELYHPTAPAYLADDEMV